MSIAYRYVAREVILVLCAVFAILMFVGLGARFTGYLQEAATGKFASEVLWTLIALRLPEFIQVVLPFSLFLAIVITYGRIHADREYVVLLAGGAPPWRMIVWTATLVVPISMLVGYISLQVTPSARIAFENVLIEASLASEFDAVIPGKFRSFSKGRRVLYVDEVDKEQQLLRGLFFVDNKNDSSVTVKADQATFLMDRQTGRRVLRLQDGTRYEGTPGSANYRIVEFAHLSLVLDLDAPELHVDNTESIPTLQLDMSQLDHVEELHWRWSLPILTLVSSLFAFGISRTPPRSGRFGQIVPGLLVFVAYYATLFLSRQLMATHSVFETLGLWPVHFIFAFGAVFWTIRQTRPT